MSWSVGLVGTPAAVVVALERNTEKLSGQSLQEYEEAKPHLIALVQANVTQQLVHLTASGHASFSASTATELGVKTYANCSVSLSGLSAQLVTEE